MLGVSADASAPAIKQAYRRLIKRWHPDLYPNGTPAHAEAVQMTKRINDAYATAGRAPLRYHRRVAPEPTATTRMSQPEKAPAYDATGYDIPLPANSDKIEYWVRFVCGASTGAFLCAEIIYVFVGVAFALENWRTVMLIAAALALAFGVGAARHGDRIWHPVFRRGWWFWS